jgi:hypothetical protein
MFGVPAPLAIYRSWTPSSSLSILSNSRSPPASYGIHIDTTCFKSSGVTLSNSGIDVSEREEEKDEPYCSSVKFMFMFLAVLSSSSLSSVTEDEPTY